MFFDNGLSFAMGSDVNPEHRLYFRGRIVLLSILAFLFYPFLWAWTVIGSMWFTSAHNCLPEEGQKWGFLIWLLFSYCGLIATACIFASKWLIHRQLHLQSRPIRSPISELQVLADLIRVPRWTLRTSQLVQESRSGGSEMPQYHPGLSLTPVQREAVEALIQQLPKFRLKRVPTECSSCPICLEEFEVGTEVRGLPCAHNFHVTCIDEWLRLNVKCPHCRCLVFPQLHLIGALNPHSTADNDIGRRGGDNRQGGTSTFFVNMPSGLVRGSAHAQSHAVRLQDSIRVLNVELPAAQTRQGDYNNVGPAC